MDETRGEPIAESLLRRERAAFDVHARSDDEIRFAARDRGENVVDFVRIVGAVGVHEENDIDIIGEFRQRAGASGAIAAVFDMNNCRAAARRDDRRRIATAVVADDDIAHDTAIDRREQRPDRIFFIECGNDEGGDQCGRGYLVAWLPGCLATWKTRQLGNLNKQGGPTATGAEHAAGAASLALVVGERVSQAPRRFQIHLSR